MRGSQTSPLFLTVCPKPSAKVSGNRTGARACSGQTAVILIFQSATRACSAALEILNSRTNMFVFDGFPLRLPSGFEFGNSNVQRGVMQAET